MTIKTKTAMAALSAFMLVVALAPNAQAKHIRSKAVGPVTAFCGDRYCASADVPARPSVRSARRHQRRAAVDANGAAARPAPGYCREDTAAGPITIACALAPKMKGFIADVVAQGFKGRVKCLSYSPSHVARSLHKIGEACDFAQCGWNCAPKIMYRVRTIAAKWGLRDGCSFRDCGHIDSGRIRSAGRDRHKNLYEAVADFHAARGAVQ